MRGIWKVVAQRLETWTPTLEAFRARDFFVVVVVEVQDEGRWVPRGVRHHCERKRRGLSGEPRWTALRRTGQAHRWANMGKPLDVVLSPFKPNLFTEFTLGLLCLDVIAFNLSVSTHFVWVHVGKWSSYLVITAQRTQHLHYFFPLAITNNALPELTSCHFRSPIAREIARCGVGMRVTVCQGQEPHRPKHTVKV